MCVCIYIAVQSRLEQGEMIRIQGFEPLEGSVAEEAPPPPPTTMYDPTGGMLSEMINCGGPSSSLHMLKYPNNNSSLQSSFVDQGLGHVVGSSQYTWIQAPEIYSAKIGTLMEMQGLSLSLSSSWRGLEAAKLEELSSRNGGIYSNNNNTDAADQLLLHSEVDAAGYGAAEPTRAVNVLRNSRYLKAAQELLEEFCFVGRGKLKNLRVKKSMNNDDETGNPNPNKEHNRDPPPPPPPPPSSSPAERSEHQRRKIKLLSMLDEACNSFLLISTFQSSNIYNY